MIFVTGGTGFIGAHMLLHLARNGSKIRAIMRQNSSRDFLNQLSDFYRCPEIRDNIEWIECDLDDAPGLAEAVSGCHTVYHCAGKVSFSEKDWDELLKVNRSGTANVVNAALETGVEKFCLISSVAALDMSQGIKGKKTDWKIFRKEQPYGYSKYLAELEVYRGNEEGMKVVVINPAVVIGPSQRSNPLSGFISRLEKGTPFYPTGSTGFVSADEVCLAAIEGINTVEDKIQLTVCRTNMDFVELIRLFCQEGNFRVPKTPLSGFSYYTAMGIARFLKFFGFRSSLSVSGLRSLSNKGSYSIDDLEKTGISGKGVEEAAKEAVRFFQQKR